jgi:hypothetical protein
VLLAAGARQVVLDQEQVLARPLDGREQVRHRRDLLALLLKEPVEELLADEVPLLARQRDEPDDLFGDALLLLERERDGLGRAPDVVTGRSESSRNCTIIIAWFRSSTAWR